MLAGILSLFGSKDNTPHLFVLQYSRGVVFTRQWGEYYEPKLYKIILFRILIREREMTFTKELQIIRSDKKEGNFNTF